jgi:hypothetical protein
MTLRDRKKLEEAVVTPPPSVRKVAAGKAKVNITPNGVATTATAPSMAGASPLKKAIANQETPVPIAASRQTESTKTDRIVLDAAEAMASMSLGLPHSDPLSIPQGRQISIEQRLEDKMTPVHTANTGNDHPWASQPQATTQEGHPKIMLRIPRIPSNSSANPGQVPLTAATMRSALPPVSSEVARQSKSYRERSSEGSSTDEAGYASALSHISITKNLERQDLREELP